MGTSCHRRSSFSLIELLLCLILLGLTAPALSMTLTRHLKRKGFLSDIENLQNQLQMAHDFVLHDQLLAKIHFSMTPAGLLCKVEFENKELEKKLPTRKIYKKIRHFKIAHLNEDEPWSFICSFSGGLKHNVGLSFYDHLKIDTRSIEMKGYPHVLEFKN